MSDTFRKNYNSIFKLHSYEKEMKSKAEELEKYFQSCPGREMSLAITNLEQSIMWATKAIYKNTKSEYDDEILGKS